jgi:uncharacterized membrane protein YdjX (TVP38/TMEM64 family)
MGARWENIEKTKRFLGRGYADEIILIGLRAAPIFPISVVSVLCGAVRMRPITFIITTFIGTVIRIGTLALFGWYAGHEYALYAARIAMFEQIVLAAALAAVIFFIVKKRF